jgi:hypothetical protein
MTDLHTLLATIGWPPSELVRRLDVNERTVRRWMGSDGLPRAGMPPPAIMAWLGEVAAWIEAHPAPRRLDQGQQQRAYEQGWLASGARGLTGVALDPELDGAHQAPWPHDMFPPDGEHD